LVVVYGCDKGGIFTTLLMHVAIMIDGNTQSNCDVLAQYKDGAENHHNLAKTIYCKDFPIQPFVQQLVNDQLHVILVIVKDAAGQVVSCKSTVAPIFTCAEDEWIKNARVQLIRHEDCAEDASFLSDAVHGTRFNDGILDSLNLELNADEELGIEELGIELVTTGHDEYAGFRLLQGPTTIMIHRWTDPLKKPPVADAQHVECRVLHISVAFWPTTPNRRGPYMA
jgi:hypothetical protein